jgi:hypothetical protein
MAQADQIKEGYDSTNLERNIEGFNVGLDFTDIEITEMGDRDGPSHFWCYTITEEALIDGFDLLDTDGEILTETMEQFEDFFEETNYLEEMRRAVSLTRQFGACGILHFDDGLIKAFPRPDMELSFDPVTRKFVSGTLIERLQYTTDKLFEHKLGFDKINNSFVFMIFKEKRKTLEGRSELEPIWDDLNGLYIASFLEVIAVAKATGAVILQLKEARALKTDAQKAAASAPLREFGHTLSLILPDDAKVEVTYPKGVGEISTLVQDLYIKLAVASGYPLEAWRGSQQGNQSGAFQTTKKLYEVHKTIQKRAKKFYKQSIKILAGILGITLPEKFVLEWRFKEVVSDKEQSDKELVDAQTDAIDAQEFTGNELRARRGEPPLPFFDEPENKGKPLQFVTNSQNNINFNATGLGFDNNDGTNPTEPGQADGEPDDPTDRDTGSDSTDESDPRNSDSNG